MPYPLLKNVEDDGFYSIKKCGADGRLPYEKLPTWPNSRIDELLPLSPEVIEAIKRNRHQGAKW